MNRNGFGSDFEEVPRPPMPEDEERDHRTPDETAYDQTEQLRAELDKRFVTTRQNDLEQALRLNRLFDLDQERYGHVAAWNRDLFTEESE